ncbi:hypothetical protein KAR48_15075 [bacterium]|nr:hypothetical protein [bacterium]
MRLRGFYLKGFATILMLLCVSCAYMTGANFMTLDSNVAGKPVIAVLPFEVNNLNASAQLGSLAASELAHGIFVSKRGRVVDSSVILDAIVQSDFDARAFDVQQLSELCRKLHADYLILGRIESLTESILMNPDEEACQKIRISVRVLNGITGSVEGVILHQFDCKQGLRHTMYEEIYSMAHSIRFKSSIERTHALSDTAGGKNASGNADVHGRIAIDAIK